MATFDTSKLLVVNCSEIEGLEDVLGSFTLKRLNLKERVTVSANKSELTKGKEVEVLFDNIAFVLSTLELAVTKKPESVILEELEVESLFSLYAKYSEWVDSFRKKFQSVEKASS